MKEPDASELWPKLGGEAKGDCDPRDSSSAIPPDAAGAVVVATAPAAGAAGSGTAAAPGVPLPAKARRGGIMAVMALVAFRIHGRNCPHS